MKNKVINWIAGILIIILAVSSVFLMTTLFIRREELRKQKQEKLYEALKGDISYYFGIDAPNDIETVFHYFEGFQDWDKYTCYKLSTYPTEWLEENSFIEGPEDHIKYHVSLLYDWKSNPIPDEYKIDFDKKYYAKSNGYRFLVFSPDNLMLALYVFTM